jgi:very-short-patch-repair endonuclease
LGLNRHMRGQLTALDVAVAALAAGQHGIVAFWQLIELGMGRDAIQHRVRIGRLHPVHRGVFAVGYPAGTREAFEMAAVLACGDDAVVSHWTATGRWTLLRPSRGPIHVTAPTDRRGRKGVKAHWAELHPHDRTKRDGIPVTSVPRTLLDIAGVANERTLRRAVNQAARSGWLNRRAIDELLERNPRRKGSKQLRTVIASVTPATRRTRSDLEVAFLELCAAYGLPEPLSNTKVLGFEVDLYWPEATLIGELDSYEYHRTPYEFESDRRRDAHLKRNGYEVLRVGEGWLNSDPADVAETVRSLLGCPG